MCSTFSSVQLERLGREGYVVLHDVFPAPIVDQLATELSKTLGCAQDEAEAIRSRAGSVYAARNVLALCPATREVWRRPQLVALLREVLGPKPGLVRALFFDKPPERTWALPWHKDLTIAVRDNQLPTTQFCKPTTKAGVPHVEGSREVLESMLTLRIHLDDVTEENGPLRVMPGSHRTGKEFVASDEICSILVGRGDVLAMRPLIAHSSPASHPTTNQHRRILHLEFSGQAHLADGFEWHEFTPV